MQKAGNLFGSAGVLLISAMLVGCVSLKKQKFTGHSPDELAGFLARNRNVVEVSTRPLKISADYNLREQLSMLAPRARKWKLDVEWTIERVIKGRSAVQTMLVKGLFLVPEETRKLGLFEPRSMNTFTNGLILWVGFDDSDGNSFRHLNILKPTENQRRHI